jgi:hypothetical protein
VQFVTTAPDHAKQVLESLQEAMRDKDSGVRSAANEALGKFSIEQFMDAYWATQNQGLNPGPIPIIATQLYHTPLVVRTSKKQDQKQIVLYPTTGKPITWDKPQQEVQRFVQQIKNAAKLKWRFWPFLK